ncbi:MAG: hypothetical protein WHZ52_05040 [Armatimonadota bacterium]|jgi:flagellar motor switch protein FliG
MNKIKAIMPDPSQKRSDAIDEERRIPGKTEGREVPASQNSQLHILPRDSTSGELRGKKPSIRDIVR